MQNQQNSFRAWLEIIRLPNLFTVIGDPLAGCAIAMTCGRAPEVPNILFLCLVSLSAYIFGLLTNDLHDQTEDSKLRPERPLPSGKLSRSSVKLANAASALLCLVFSLFLSNMAFITALLLLLMTYAYNFLFKDDIRTAAPTMGACRGINLILGATACGTLPAITLIPAIGSATAIALITFLASKENKRVRLSQRLCVLPTAVLLVTWVIFLLFCHNAFTAAFICWLATGLIGAYPILKGNSIRSTVGWQITSLIPWQFSIIGLTGIISPVQDIAIAIILTIATVILSHSFSQS